MNETIAVIGAGNGGTAMTAHLLSIGRSVNLCDIFPEYLFDIQKQGNINLNYEDKITKVKPELVTSDVSEAIKGVKLIMVVTPAFTHKMIAEECSKYLEDGQIVVLNPGRTAGALEFFSTLRKSGCNKDIIVAETQTLIYSCRKTNGNSVSIYGIKKSVDISCIPNYKINEVMTLLKPCFPQFNPVPSTTWTSFANIGSMFHPVPVLLNIGRIENDKKGFKYYWEGISPSVAMMIEIIDEERLSVARAFGVDIMSAKEWLIKSHYTYGDTLHERIINNEAYENIYAPTTIQARYVTEDVPTGLVPISELGKIVDVPTPNIDAIIKLTSSLYKIDFRETGRSLNNLGIKNMMKEDILLYFSIGKK